MTVTHVLVGLAIWTAISVVVGVGLGSFLKYCAANDDLVPSPSREPRRRSA
jgi:hypothetical protein